MRSSKVLKKLREGKIASCFKINLSDPSVIEIAAASGFDCLWTDMEHVPNDWSVIKNQVLAAKTQDTDLMVRVSRGSYSDYIKPFELDASGIMVPHVMNVRQAKDLVQATRFHPIGRRPIDGGNADGGYCRINLQQYIAHGNQEKFVMIQIEDPEPFADLEEIAALAGMDIIFFGVHDFSHAIGAPGNRNHPEVHRGLKRIAQVARDNGKVAGAVANPDNIEDLIGMGYRFLSMGADVVGLGNYCDAIMKRMSNYL